MHFPQNVHEPKAKLASREAIENFAEEIAHRYDFHQFHQPGYVSEKLHQMVLALIEKMGGRIFKGEAPAPKANARDESLVVFANDDFLLAPFASDWNSLAKTQAVTNAAELGHVFLHYPEIKAREGEGAVMVCPRHPKTPREVKCDAEARWFAEALIFPRAAFNAAWTHHKGNASAIAQEYGVTEKLILSRAGRLGYIVPDTEFQQMPSRLHRAGTPTMATQIVTIE